MSLLSWIKPTVRCLLVPLAIAIGFSRTASAQDFAKEGERAVGQLKSMHAILVQAEPMVERPYLPDLYLYRKRIEEVLKSIETKGLAHMATVRAYQRLILKFRHSSSYFKDNATPSLEKNLALVQDTIKAIIEERGIDDSPYTKLTLDTFEELRGLLMELDRQAQDPELRRMIVELMPDFGEVIALAAQGDRPKTHDAARIAYRKMKPLHERLYHLGERGRMFELSLNIQGLINFYGVYAQEKD